MKKVQIIEKLETEYGIIIKNSQMLNKIMAEMGLHHKYGNGWSITQAGAKYCVDNIDVINSNDWRESVVKAIAMFCKDKK